MSYDSNAPDPQPIPFTPDVAKRLREITPYEGLNERRRICPVPAGYWALQPGGPGTKLFLVHVAGSARKGYVWVEGVTHVGGATDPRPERYGTARLVSVAEVRRKRRKGMMLPASELDRSISKKRAHTLHKKMARAGIADHYAFARRVRPSGFPVPDSLTALSARQAADLEEIVAAEISKRRLGPARARYEDHAARAAQA